MQHPHFDDSTLQRISDLRVLHQQELTKLATEFNCDVDDIQKVMRDKRWSYGNWPIRQINTDCVAFDLL